MREQNQLQLDAQKLLQLVKAELDREIPHTPNWVVVEGERALDNAVAFFEAVGNDKAQELLSGSTIREFIGETWVDLCDEVYQHCEVMQIRMSANAS